MSRIMNYAARKEYRGHLYSIFCHKSDPGTYNAVTDEGSDLRFCLAGDTPEEADSLAREAINLAIEVLTEKEPT